MNAACNIILKAYQTDPANAFPYDEFLTQLHLNDVQDLVEKDEEHQALYITLYHDSDSYDEDDEESEFEDEETEESEENNFEEEDLEYEERIIQGLEYVSLWLKNIDAKAFNSFKSKDMDFEMIVIDSAEDSQFGFMFPPSLLLACGEKDIPIHYIYSNDLD